MGALSSTDAKYRHKNTAFKKVEDVHEAHASTQIPTRDRTAGKSISMKWARSPRAPSANRAGLTVVVN
jgi:hypothetical protein